MFFYTIIYYKFIAFRFVLSISINNKNILVLIIKKCYNKNIDAKEGEFMKSRITTFIISIIIILIFCCLAIFGVIVYSELKQIDTSKVIENMTTVFSDITDEVKENIGQLETNLTTNNNFDDIQDANVNKTEVNNSNYNNIDNNIEINKYFYNQLEEPSKIIYKAFEKNKENMKTGTYEINFGNSFSDILSQTNGQERLSEYYQSAIEAYTYDNPEIFYLDPNKMYLNVETTTTLIGKSYKVFINKGNQNNYFIDEFQTKSQVDLAIQQIEQVKNDVLKNITGNTYEDIKLVHDYLIDNIEYDKSISKDNIYNVYGALVNKISVCEGYARSFKYIIDEMKIPCVLVVGNATNSEGKTENHAWNYINLNNNWYAIDVTWDDPIIVGGGKLNKELKYKYFLKGKNTFLLDHNASGQFTENGKVFKYPNLSDKDL